MEGEVAAGWNGPGWLALDENVRACVLLHLQPQDLTQVALVSKEMARETLADVVWATLFLRRFCADFWGEEAGPHPYYGVPEREPNEWLQRSATGVFTAFHESSSQQGVSGRLLAFVQQHQGPGGAGGWKHAYKRMHEAVSAWLAPAHIAFIIAGHTSFARLSAITDIIKTHVGKDFFLDPIKWPDPSRTSSPSAMAPLDVLAPTGECRVLRMPLSAALTFFQWNLSKDAVANLCVLRRPRNWWGKEGDLFRGLQLQKNQYALRLMVVYAIDCERMDDPDYQEEAFRELHGVLGEGKGHNFHQGLCVNLHLINPKSISHVDSIRERLKIPLFQHPHHSCPYYAGPVVFVVTAFTFSDRETADQKREREALVKAAFSWLHKQPSTRPDFGAPDQASTWLCALSDARSIHQLSDD